MLDYASIKDLAQQIGRTTKDLVALAQKNDPFYAGLPNRQREAEWFAEIWERFGFSYGVHLRRIHYVLISQSEEGEPALKPDGEPYLNTTNDSGILNRASLSARYLDLIPLDALVDRRNDEPMLFVEPGMTSAGWLDVVGESPFVDLPYLDLVDPPMQPFYSINGFYSSQDYVVEVWIEKSTQNDWLVPLCRRREVNLMVGIGKSSEIQSRHLAERVQEAGRPARIIYMSDFDPAGRSMPVSVARKLEFYIGKFDFDLDVTLTPLVLTEAQCLQHRLPRTPIKESERRRGKFEEKFGAGATELDALEALHPGEMGKLLEQELDRYLDTTLDERVHSARWEFNNQLRKISEEVAESYQEEIDELTSEFDAVVKAKETLVETAEAWEESAADLWETMAEGMRERKPDLPELPTARPAKEPDGFVLFDSKRDYLNQIDAYREWQRR